MHKIEIVMEVLKVHTYFLESCCVANGVSDECLGLCIDEPSTDTSRFVSICDKYANAVEKCTIGSGGNSWCCI